MEITGNQTHSRYRLHREKVRERETDHLQMHVHGRFSDMSIRVLCH